MSTLQQDPPLRSHPDRSNRLAGMPVAERARMGRYILKLAFELAVVFIGVYGAIALESRQAERETERRRVHLKAALVREIESISAHTRNASLASERMMAHYDSAWAAGGRPALRPMIEPVRVENHMWQTALQSGALDLLDVPTLYRMSQFYNELNAGFEQLAQLGQLSEETLLPRMGDPGSFYDPRTGALRPEFAWYPAGVRRLGYIASQVTAKGDGLAAELGAPPAPGTKRTSGTVP